MKQYTKLRTVLFCILLACSACYLLAQDETPTAVTVQNRSGDLPFSSSVGSGVEHVDLMSGNLTVDIPISQVPGRGLDYNFNLLYDARWLVVATRGGPTNTLQLWNVERRLYVPDNGFGWQTNQPSLTYVSHVGDVNSDSAPCTLNQSGPQAAFHRVYNTGSFIFSDSSSAKHPLILNKEDGTACVPSYVVNNDKGPDQTGAGLWADNSPFGSGPPTIHLADGTALSPSGCTLSIADGYLCSYVSATDVHGNQSQFGAGGTDSVGRVNVTQSSATNQIIYSVHDAAGNPRSYTVNYAPFQIATAFNAVGFDGPITEYNGTRNAITSVVLPDNTSYTFQYDNYGGLTQLTLPTGAMITYGWSTFGTADGMIRYVSSRTVTVNGVASRWLFARSQVSNHIVVTMTDPANNQSVYTSGDTGAVVGDVKIYNSSATGTPLREYQIAYRPDDTDSSPILPTSVTTTLENGLVSKKEFDYDTFNYNHYQCIDPTSCPENGPTLFSLPESRGNVIAIREYGFGQGAPGSLLRTTTNKYLADLTDNPSTGAQYAAQNIVSKIIQQTITDNVAGTTAADSKYEYDNLTTSGPFLGNATSVKRWRNTDNAWLATTYAYDQFGHITSITDPGQHITQWSYADLWAASVGNNCVPAAGSQVYPSLVTNAKQQRLQITHFPCTGQVQAHQNENDLENGMAGTTHTYDLLNRPLAVTDVLGGQTSFSYPNATTVIQSKKITGTLSDTSTSLHDGFGRVTETQHPLPNGTALVDTTYDLTGRVATVTNPYFTTSDPTYGTTSSQYDGLGRVTQTTKQDGSMSTVSYNGNCTTASDEAGKQRKSCTDALGRLIEVDEPNPTAPATPAQGTLTINGSLQSHTSSGTAAVVARSSVSIWSGDGSGADMHVNDPNEPCPPAPRTCPQIYDTGWVQVTINGIVAKVNYGRFDTWTSVATNLASAINNSGASAYVTASASSTTISLQAKTAGAAGNSITLSVTSATNDPGDFGGSFGGNSSGATLSGGADAVNPVTTYDQGTVILTIGSFTASASYGQSGNSTGAQVATALVSTSSTGLNRAGSPVSATANGANITIIYGTAGPEGDAVSVTGSSQSTQTQWAFSPPSFSSAGTSLANGLNVGDVNNNPLVTLYQYDGLGNLLCVEQHGGVTGTGCSSSPTNDASSPWRVRRFAYDSAGRLLTAKNPESGTISYTYDNDGNLLQKTSPAPNQTGSATQTITYCYDELHRVTGRGYGAQSCPLTSPVVGYTYDSGVNGKGHLISLIDQAGTATSTYDVLGRVVTETRSIAGASKSIGYTYNLDSSIKTLTYPSGRVVTYTPDSAGRLVSAVDGNGTNYVISASYNPDGSLKGFLNGSTPALNSSVQYNPRLQLCRITALTSGTAPTSCTDSQHIGNVMDRGYDFHAGNGAPGSGTDNGNVMAITNYRDTSRSQGFTYDPLNRLTAGWSMANTGNYSWGENYSIDAWGNLQITPMQGKAHGGNFTLSSTVQNRPTGLSYDAAGNMRSYLFATYTYDSENRLASTSGMSYTYDGNGERVLKSQTVGGIAVKSYWSMGGKTLAESDGSGNLTAEYVYFASKRIARIDLPANIVHYYLSDHINSISTVVSAAGVIEEESDYSSFGTEYPISETGNNRYKFTGKERDTETGLDNFGARYFGNAFGRFLSPDPDQVSGFENKEDPQSWSGYAYARNNPLKYVDSDGDSYHVCDEHGQNCNNIDDEAADRAQKAGDIWKDGKIYLRGDDGSLQFKGTYQDQGRDIPGDPAQNIAAAGMIVATTNAAMKEFGKNAAYAATGTVVLRGVGLGIEALQAARAAKTAAQIEGETVVIGKLADLENLGEGERTLTLPNQGNPQANWVQNSSRLRQAMSSGEPIRDASVGNPAGNTGFLRAERYLLQDHGWTLKGEYWYPPEK